MANLKIRRGATYNEPLSLGMDLTDATVYFTAKSAYDNDVTDAAAVIKKDITVHSDPTAGITTLALSSDETSITPGEYLCDVQVKLVDGTVIIYKPETLTIEPAVGLRS